MCFEVAFVNLWMLDHSVIMAYQGARERDADDFGKVSEHVVCECSRQYTK